MGSPALLSAQSAKALSAVNNSSKYHYRRVDMFGLLADGSTPTSTTAWVTTLSVAVPACVMLAPSGTVFEAAASATGMTAGDTFTNSGTSAAQVYGHIVYDMSSGSPVLTTVWGTQHASAASKLSTAEIASSLGSSEFVRLGDVLLEQSGAAAETVTFDSTTRSGFGQMSAGFNGGLAESEDAMNDAADSTGSHG